MPREGQARGPEEQWSGSLTDGGSSLSGQAGSEVRGARHC